MGAAQFKCIISPRRRVKRVTARPTSRGREPPRANSWLSSRSIPVVQPPPSPNELLSRCAESHFFNVGKSVRHLFDGTCSKKIPAADLSPVGPRDKMHPVARVSRRFLPPPGAVCAGRWPGRKKGKSDDPRAVEALSAPRGINPRLNSVTDQVTEIVRSLEKTLVDELKIGIDASEWFMSEPGGEPGVTREHYLAFSRVGSAGYRINVCIVTTRQKPEAGTESAPSARLNEERVLWSSCSRELKLKASEKLPALLDNIIKNAERLLKTADDTAATIKEMLGGDTEPAPPPREEPARRGFFGRSRRRAYSVQDAMRAHRHYFLDNLGVSETALNSLCSDGWVETAPAQFAARDQSGRELCSVVFVDDEGSAEVNFPDGEADSVTIDLE